MPSSTDEARPPLRSPAAAVPAALLAAFLTAAAVAGAASADERGAAGSGGDYASVEASISPRGTASISRTVPVPLARNGAPGAPLPRAGRPLSSTGDCRWPDERTLAAVVPVATDRGSHASGVVFATDRVLTAAHAVAGGERFFVRVGHGYRTAELLLLDIDADIAVLRVDTLGIAPLPIADHDPIERQPVWAVGFPREAGRTTTNGVFQRNREGALHASAPIDSGQSGGGLLACEHGEFRVLGMLRGFGAYRDGDGYVKLDNHSVSVAGRTIHRVLAGR